MSTKVKKAEVQVRPKEREIKTQQKPSFLITLEQKWVQWTGITPEKEPGVAEAINDFSGDLYLELRKLTAQLCTEVENRNYSDEFKEIVKTKIDESWRNIIDHQKIGLDKLSLIVRKYIKDEV
jgi:hypothetical protein